MINIFVSAISFMSSVSKGIRPLCFSLRNKDPLSYPATSLATNPFKHNLAMSCSHVKISIVLQSTKPGTLDKRLWLRAHGSALLVMKTGIKVSASASFSAQYLNLKSFALDRRKIFLFYGHAMFCRMLCYFYWAPKWAHLYGCADTWNSLLFLIGKSTSLHLSFSINCAMPSVFSCFWARLWLFMSFVFIFFN